MNREELKTRATRFEGRGHIDVTIESNKDMTDPSVPEACRIHIDWRGDDSGLRTPEDSLWLDDMSDLEVLHDAIGAYLEMRKENLRRKGGDHGDA